VPQAEVNVVDRLTPEREGSTAQSANDWDLRLGMRTKAEVSDVIAWSDLQIGPDCTG